MAAKKLIEKDQVLAVVGTTTSGTTLAIMKTFEEAQTPLVSCAASVKIVEPVNKWVFKTPQSDRDAVLKILEYLEKQGINKIAFINDSNAYGVSGKIEIEALAPQRGMEIVAKETFGGEDTDMTPQLTRIKGTKAQAVICWGTNPGPAIVARNMKQLKMSIPLIQSHGVANAKFIELAGDAAEGVLLPSGRLIVAEQLPDGHPQKQMLVDYKTAYTAKYNKPVSTFGGHAYDAIKILAGALERAGADKAKIRDEIENTKNFVGTAGIFNYSAEDHYGLDLSAFSMVEIKGGQWQLLSE
jgi:branched-chain amino acid transport system substrate-binding protein